MFRSKTDALHVIGDAFDVCYRSWYMLCTMLLIYDACSSLLAT